MSVTATRDPLMPVIGVVTDIRIDTPDVKTFRVVTPDGKKAFEHRPGQCAMLSVPGVGEAMFSITSSPTNTEFMEFSIKKCGCVTEWLHSMEDSVNRSSLIGDAILYTLNQENYLRRYLDDGHLSIDNSVSAPSKILRSVAETGCLPRVYVGQMPAQLFIVLQKPPC